MLAPCQIVSAIGVWNDLGARQTWPGSIPNRVDLPQKILPLSGPAQLATTSASHINSPANDHADMSFEASREIPRYPESDSFISLAKLADSSASEMVRNTSFHPSSEPTLSRVFLRTFPTRTPENSMGARAIWARRVALHKRINHNQHKRRGKGPRRGHSRTFYPRPARSRSSFRPTSQVEHHQ